jgi:hypothetical protein
MAAIRKRLPKINHVRFISHTSSQFMKCCVCVMREQQACQTNNHLKLWIFCHAFVRAKYFPVQISQNVDTMYTGDKVYWVINTHPVHPDVENKGETGPNAYGTHLAIMES